MATVNLLPWRERRRHQQQRQFIRILLLVVTITVMAVWFWQRQITHQLQLQQQRNAFLQQHLAELEQDYQRQQALYLHRSSLTQQMQRLDRLQRNPLVFVQLLETLARAVPDNVYLTSLQQSAGLIEMAGRVDQPSSLTALLRNLNASPLLTDATLVTIATDPAESSTADHQFRLEVHSDALAEEAAG